MSMGVEFPGSLPYHIFQSERKLSRSFNPLSVDMELFFLHLCISPWEERQSDWCGKILLDDCMFRISREWEEKKVNLSPEVHIWGRYDRAREEERCGVKMKVKLYLRALDKNVEMP